MSDGMLGRLSLSLVQGPRDDLDQKLASKHGPWWLRRLNEVLREKPDTEVDDRRGSRAIPAPTVDSTSKFALLADLGIITVPKGYKRATRLTDFHAWNYKKFAYYNDAITDANFPNPSRILKPGDRLRVRVFQQVVPGTTTSEERMAFLVREGCTVYVGAQGAALVFDQKRNQLPKGKWYASFDDKERLFEDADGYHRVPYVGAGADGDFKFDLGDFEGVWDDYYAFFGFCDVE